MAADASTASVCAAAVAAVADDVAFSGFIADIAQLNIIVVFDAIFFKPILLWQISDEAEFVQEIRWFLLHFSAPLQSI